MNTGLRNSYEFLMKELLKDAFGCNLNEPLECGNVTTAGGQTVTDHHRAAGVNNRAAN